LGNIVGKLHKLVFESEIEVMIGQYQIPQNSVKMQKFHRDGQTPWLGS